MGTISLDELQGDFKEKALLVIKNCKENGHVLIPFFAMRSIYDQARLWRQSRPLQQVEQAISLLEENGAIFLSSVLEAVGPQYGRWATNALPGVSWHQHGQALDCFVLDKINNRAVWSAKHPGYAVYAHEAVALGLIAGYNWSRKDSVHIQYLPKRVLDQYTWRELDELMFSTFPPSKEEVSLFGGQASQENIRKLQGYYHS